MYHLLHSYVTLQSICQINTNKYLNWRIPTMQQQPLMPLKLPLPCPGLALPGLWVTRLQRGSLSGGWR